MNLENIGAIVTGGASGLGEATTRMLAKRGVKVAIFDLNDEQGKAIAAETGGAFFKVDVTSEDSVASAIAEAEAKHGPARVCVNCAGIAPGDRVVNRDGSPIPLDKFRRGIEINLIGTFNVLSKFAARIHDAEPFEDGERGVIVNTASIAAFEGQIGQASYSASKAAVAGMALPIARELARFGIRVNTIAPGLFWTPMMAGFTQEVQDSLAAQVPFPSRLGKAEEYAQMVATIIDNRMLNAEVIRLDGAIRMAAK